MLLGRNLEILIRRQYSMQSHLDAGVLKIDYVKWFHRYVVTVIQLAEKLMHGASVQQ
jgi:hypothetical protein